MSGADEVSDEPVWPTLTPEYQNRILDPPAWGWALGGFERMPSFGVGTTEGYGSHFTLDGKPFFPLWGWVKPEHREDWKPTLGAIRLDLQTMFVRQHKWWPSGIEINTEVFDRIAEENFRVNPDSYFLLEIDLYPPKDFVENHPDQMCRDDRGMINEDSANGPNYSFASDFAASQMENVLERVINYVEHQPWATRIAGYRINSGTTLEWLAWSPVPNRDGAVDFSEVCRCGYERFCREHYPEITDFSVPSKAERTARDGDDLLWNPKEHLRAVAWQEFLSERVSGMIIRMCSAAKRKLSDLGRQKLVGTYYGYLVTMPGYGNNQRRGHFGLRRILATNCVDFLLSPPEYTTRSPGNAHIDMKTFATLKANGIVSVVEHDLRTANSSFLKPPASTCNQAPTHELSLAYIRRNLSVSLCRNEPLSIFDIYSGQAYDFPESRRDIALMRETGRFCLERKVRRAAEVAVVYSEKAVTTLAESDLLVTAPVEPYQEYNGDGTVRVREVNGAIPWYDTHIWNNSRWGRCGAPVDYLLAEDLENHAGDYRLYVFPNAWRYDARFASAVARLRARKCMILWFYAPGYVSMDGAGTETMERLTGLRFERVAGKTAAELTMADGRKMGIPSPEVEPLFRCVSPEAKTLGTYANGDVGAAAVKDGESVGVFCGTWRPDVPFLRKMVQASGAHVFCASGDPLEANARLISFHARYPGRKTIRLPRKTTVLDVFARRIVARDVDEFSFDAKLHSSHLFYYGNDAADLLARLAELKVN